MSKITDPIMTDEVDWKFPGRFCEYEALWKKRKRRICTAHLAEGRVFTCEKRDLKHAKSDPGYCADAEPPRKSP